MCFINFNQLNFDREELVREPSAPIEHSTMPKNNMSSKPAGVVRLVVQLNKQVSYQLTLFI